MQPDKQEQSLQTMMQLNDQESEHDTGIIEESTLLLSEEDKDGFRRVQTIQTFWTIPKYWKESAQKTLCECI